jgi:hypothetical protein
MNERIKELAEQAGLAYKMSNGKYWIDAGEPDIHLERFAELVRQDEREACARLCEELSEKWYDEGGSASDCATAIRARGEK